MSLDPTRRLGTTQRRSRMAGLAARTAVRRTAADGSSLLRPRSGTAGTGGRRGAVAAVQTQPTLQLGTAVLQRRPRRPSLVPLGRRLVPLGRRRIARGDRLGPSGFKTDNPAPVDSAATSLPKG